jgi:hypothetical protein
MEMGYPVAGQKADKGWLDNAVPTVNVMQSVGALDLMKAGIVSVHTY